MKPVNINAVFVGDGERVGLVTGMNLAKALILKRMPLETPVGDLAHYDVVTLAPDEFVFQALLLMSKHNKRRLAVREGESMSASSRILISSASSREMRNSSPGASSGQTAGRTRRRRGRNRGQVRLLRRQGVKVEVVAEIASDLSRRLQASLYDMLAPSAWRRSACLVVMGSEGRGEQTCARTRTTA